MENEDSTRATLGRRGGFRPVLSISLIAALLLSLSALAASAEGPGSVPDLPGTLDSMISESAWQASLLTGFGTFTYGDTGLPSPFSRYLEDSLKSALTKTSRLRLFNSSVAAAMDDNFKKAYGDFFKSNRVDALLSGRYYLEGGLVRSRLELTGLADGVLIGAVDLRMPVSSLPAYATVDPSASALATSSSLAGLDADSGKGRLKVSVSTERGESAAYREGEKMVVLVTVNEAAWIKVYHVDALGVVRLILPNKFSPAPRRMERNGILRIPSPGDAFSFLMTPPFGTEFIKVVASTRPFAESELAAGGEAFAELGTDARGAITRGLRVTGDSASPDEGPIETAEAAASYVILPKQ